tara:strand:+ start:295 stop:648 length:354 start_codon:yes stop_codon:yes gene_type:complete
LSDFTRQTIRFGIKNTYVDVPMMLSVSDIKSYAETINTFILPPKETNKLSKKYKKGNFINAMVLQAPLEIWQELYRKKLLMFVENKSYAPRIAKKIMQDDYKSTSSKYVKGEILNRA